MKNNTMKTIAWTIFGVLVVGGIIFAGTNRPTEVGAYDEFAQCIADSGTIFYGAYWCSHCTDQKELFGASAKKLPYVECSLPGGNGQTALCRERGIDAYPTWVFPDGTKQSRTFSFEELAALTGCAISSTPESSATSTSAGTTTVSLVASSTETLLGND